MISTAAVTTPSSFGLLARPMRHRRAIQALREDRHHATSRPPGGTRFPLLRRGWSRCEHHSDKALVTHARHPVTIRPRCRRVTHLHRRSDGQWLCYNCVAKSRAQPCSPCGTVREAATRDTHGRPLCPSCLITDPANQEPCIGCGPATRLARRAFGNLRQNVALSRLAIGVLAGGLSLTSGLLLNQGTTLLSIANQLRPPATQGSRRAHQPQVPARARAE